MSQTEQILAHLKTAPITPIIALNRYGCLRLAARIAELRAAGYPISSTKRKLASGKSCALYRMEGV